PNYAASTMCTRTPKGIATSPRRSVRSSRSTGAAAARASSEAPGEFQAHAPALGRGRDANRGAADTQPGQRESRDRERGSYPPRGEARGAPAIALVFEVGDAHRVGRRLCTFPVERAVGLPHLGQAVESDHAEADADEQARDAARQEEPAMRIGAEIRGRRGGGGGAFGGGR